MPCINIDEREFVVGDYRHIKEKWDKFQDFTDNKLMFRCNSVSLDRFQIYAHCYSRKTVDRWIRRGIAYRPAMLEVKIPCYLNDAPLKLPHLGSCFGRLKRLSLSKVELDSHFAELLCSGCSVLVDLELINCFNYFQGITSATLKRLVVDTCFNPDDAEHLVVITTPSLEYLNLVIQDTRDPGDEVDGVSVCNAASLIEASIYIQYSEGFPEPEKYQSRLLGGLFNVTTLELSGFETMAKLHKNTEGFPIFLNMRALSLKGCFLEDVYDLDSKLEDLGSFLENAPCLEKLTLRCCMFYADPGWDWDDERRSINLQCQGGKVLQCPKLKLIQVMYEHDLDHLLIELLWGIARRLPDARIKLTKIFR